MSVPLLVLLVLLANPFLSFAAENSPPPAPPRDTTHDMKLIPAGKFRMGCDRLGSEHGAPAHDVYLDGFMMDVHEVTNKRLEEVMPDHKLRRSRLSHCDDCPVSKITWYEAADYCYLIGKALPSEAQWEKAAGGVNGCEYPWGPDFNEEKPQARGGFKLRDGPSPVGQYPPNKYGIHDMAGNLWEWVSDWYSQGYFFQDILYNPRGPRHGVMKVRRGGAWSDDLKGMRTGYRDWSYPFSRSYSDIGFRCVINLKGTVPHYKEPANK